MNCCLSVPYSAPAGLILLEFPCELVSAVVAGRWAAASSPFKPWMVAFRVRLLMAAATTTIVSLIHGCHDLLTRPRITRLFVSVHGVPSNLALHHKG